MDLLRLPSIRARIMSSEAFRVESVVADLTRLRILMLMNKICTPWAEVVVEEWTGPFLAMRLEMPRMKVTIAVHAVFCDDFRYLAVTVRT